MRRVISLTVLGFLIGTAVFADVSIVERKQVRKDMKGRAGKSKPIHGGATGSQGLIDQSGLKFFINTNITFSTSSSASGAASEASYTHAVAATTLNGGTTSSTLNDAYDGYETMCLSLNNTVATCETGNANFVIYNKNGPATTECLGSTSGVNRQVVFPIQTVGSIQMSRKVFVPDDDSFARWLNYFTNTSASPLTVTMVVANNLGSDNNTKIVSDSEGNNTPTTASTWITSFQNYSGTTSTDVRNGHVIQQVGAAVPVAGLFFQDGNDNPFWGYTFTLAPGETKIIMDFGVGQPSNAASAAKAAQLAALTPPAALECLTTADREEVVNFSAQPPIATIPTLSGTSLAVFALLLGAAALFLVRRLNRDAAAPSI